MRGPWLHSAGADRKQGTCLPPRFGSNVFGISGGVGSGGWDRSQHALASAKEWVSIPRRSTHHLGLVRRSSLPAERRPDITDRLRAEEAVRQSEMQLREVIETI